MNMEVIIVKIAGIYEGLSPKRDEGITPKEYKADLYKSGGKENCHKKINTQIPIIQKHISGLDFVGLSSEKGKKNMRLV